LRIAVVILAGGEGSRMGGGKPLRLLGGRRLIDRAEALARQWSDILAVSIRNPAQVEGTPLDCILDEEGIEGPLAALAAALRFGCTAGGEAVLTIPADMPFLPADLLERFSAEIGLYGAAIASSNGHLHPICGLWSVSALDKLDGYLATGRRSLKGFAEAIGFRAVDWPIEPRDPFFNINSAEDLAIAERMLAG
jgi:molybdopterin-guanine dinucleotide biosynthesis protein A